MKMLVSITFEVETEDQNGSKNIISTHVYKMLSELYCKQAAQIVTSTSESYSVMPNRSSYAKP